MLVYSKDDQRLLKISNGRIIGQLNLVVSIGGIVLCMLGADVCGHVRYQRATEASLGVEDFR